MKDLGIFREGLVGMVTSGEHSGSLVPILQRGAGLYRQEQMLRKKVQKALTYPIVMLFVGSGVVTFLVAFVVPKLAGLFSEMDKALPLPTRILLGFASGIQSYGIPLLILLLLGVSFCGAERRHGSSPSSVTSGSRLPALWCWGRPQRWCSPASPLCRPWIWRPPWIHPTPTAGSK
jgi:type II secretory pathway component PulF